MNRKSKKYTTEELSQIEKIDLVNWANQSRSYLKTIYNTGNHKIEDNYINNNYPIILEQILKAGIKLSSVLEDIFREF